MPRYHRRRYRDTSSRWLTAVVLSHTDLRTRASNPFRHCHRESGLPYSLTIDRRQLQNMLTRRHNIRFPSVDTNDLSQDEAYFTLIDSTGVETRIRFHDYDSIYARQGLYEQLFYDRLKCQSPEKVVGILRHGLASEPWLFNELRVLELGAGNGMVGAELQKFGVARLVGVDISAPAAMAVGRDRPGVYDDFHAMDISNMSATQREHMAGWRFNCLVSVAALGFGDIPVRVFAEAFNLVDDGGWVAFNIKETFLDDRDTSGFSLFIKTLILSDYLHIYHMERYRHRLSIDGQPLYYFGVACRKVYPLPQEMLEAM